MNTKTPHTNTSQNLHLLHINPYVSKLGINVYTDFEYCQNNFALLSTVI